MARFYSNENFPLPVVEELRSLGHDALTVREAGNADQGIQDDAVLAFATNLKRVILTINRKHFIALHRGNTLHEGIVVCTFDANFTRQAERIHAAVAAHTNLEGQLIRVYRSQE